MDELTAVLQTLDALRRPGERPANDERSDVYDIGVALCEAVTGRPPPAGPSHRPITTAPQLDLVIRRATAADPAFRFQTTGEFAAALDLLAADLGGRLRPDPAGPGIPPATAPTVHRRRRLATVAAAPMAVLAVLAVLAGVGWAVGWPAALFGRGAAPGTVSGRVTASSPVVTRGWSARTAPAVTAASPAGPVILPGAPTGPTDGILSCPTGSFCGALVPSQAGAGQAPELETYAAGAWNEPTPPAPARLAAVSCPAAGWCVAVGQDPDVPGGARGIVETLSAGAVTAVLAPGGPGDAPDSVACAAVGSCVAVGETFSATAVWSLVSGAWQETELPVTGAAGSSGLAPRLTDVVCPAPGSCTAVGHAYSATGVEEGLALTQSAGTWHTWFVTAPPGAATTDPVSLDAVSCASPGACLAVGGVELPDGSLEPLLEASASGMWRPVALPPTPPGVARSTYLTSVSCPSVRFCAVSAWYYAHAPGNPVGSLLLTDDGGRWTVQTPGVRGLGPAPAAGPDLVPWSVSCHAVGACVAVGGYQDATGRQYGFLSTLNRGSWRSVTAPKAGLAPGAGPDPHLELEAVSCPGTACLALGAYEDGSGAVHGVVVQGTSRR